MWKSITTNEKEEGVAVSDCYVNETTCDEQLHTMSCELSVFLSECVMYPTNTDPVLFG